MIAQLTGQFPNQYQRLAPRIGFAWQPLDKTVVRGGFGMFREIFDAINYENSVTSNGLPSKLASTYYKYNSALAPDAQGPVFPNALPSTAPVFSSSSDLSIVSPDFRRRAYWNNCRQQRKRDNCRLLPDYFGAPSNRVVPRLRSGVHSCGWWPSPLWSL